MDDNEIRNAVLQALYQAHRKNPDVGHLDMNVLAADLGIDKKRMAFNISFLNAHKYTRYAAMGGIIELTDKGIVYADGPSQFNPPREYGKQKIEVSGGTVGQIVQGHSVTVNATDFLERLSRSIEEHPDLGPEKKKTWKRYIAGFIDSPVFLEVLRRVLNSAV